MARRGYPPEFRRSVVELVEGGRKVADVAPFKPPLARAAVRVAPRHARSR